MLTPNALRDALRTVSRDKVELNTNPREVFPAGKVTHKLELEFLVKRDTGYNALTVFAVLRAVFERELVFDFDMVFCF